MEIVVAVLVQIPAWQDISQEYLKTRFRLTTREAEVAVLLAARRSNKEIARSLGFTVYTAERHTERVLAKLGINSRRHVLDALTP